MDRPLVFDRDEAIAQCFGRREVFEEMVDYYFLETPSLLEAMRVGLAHRAPEAIAKAAHKLRSTLVYLGAHAAAEAAEHVEQLAMDGDLTRAPEAIERLQHRLGQFEQALEEHRSKGS